ncbi:MAG: hypothetical protein MHM6MM_005008 [Cercozoa sp. M6MM]
MESRKSEVLQRWQTWRAHLEKHTVAKASDETETPQQKKEAQSFEAFCRFLQNRQTLDTTRQFLTSLSPTPLAEQTEEAKLRALSLHMTRRMLSALMMIYFPQEVFESSESASEGANNEVFDPASLDEPDFICLSAARRLLRTLGVAHGGETDRAKPESLDEDAARVAVVEFDAAFLTWRDKDKQRLLLQLMERYHEYNRSLAFLDMHKSERQEVVRASLLQNQEQVKQKVIRLGGKKYFETELERFNLKLKAENATRRQHMELWRKYQAERSAARVGDDSSESKAGSTETHTSSENAPSLGSSDSGDSAIRNVSSLRLRAGLRSSGSAADEDEKQSVADEEPTPEQKLSEELKKHGIQTINLDAIIAEESSKLYWRKFEQKLEGEDYSQVVEFLNEVAARLKALTPNRADLHALLDAAMDRDLLAQMIDRKVLDGMTFYKVFKVIHTSIKNLQAASMDREWQAWHDEQVALFTKPDARWSKILPGMFNRIFTQLDRVEAATKHYRSIMEQKAAKLAAHHQ